jgi:FkbM family methyltransferase
MLAALKAVTRTLGVYSLARSIYRRVHPGHRRERSCNLQFYRQLVRPGDLCFDIGANVGQTTEAMRALGATVVGVEPNPHCIPVLQSQFGRDRGVHLVQKAIGAAPGRAELHFRGTDSTASIRTDWPFPADQRVDVEVTTLDDLIREFGRPRLIKVDVEGFELEVFQGLSQPVPLLYFEMHGQEAAVVTTILTRLASVGDVEGVNAVDAENAAWLLDRWVKPGEFLPALGSPPPHRANVVVRMRA